MIASYLIPRILRPLGYAPRLPNNHVWKYLAVPFQALNEEMVIRAFLLTSLMRVINRPIAVSAAVAAMFAVHHCLLYSFGPPNTALSIEALMTLFLVALALNQFFVTTGNIAIPYGVHLGWNVTRFGNDWISQRSGISLPEGTDFNLIEGNSLVLALAATLLVLAIGVNHLLAHSLNFRTAPLSNDDA
jgi:membrane protease YdiL (CAAX protease family)